jgi:hypothetical protein
MIQCDARPTVEVDTDIDREIAPTPDLDKLIAIAVRNGLSVAD